jgi:hypothetical protein
MSRYEDETKEFRELEREKMRKIKKLLKRKKKEEQAEESKKEKDVSSFDRVNYQTVDGVVVAVQDNNVV